IYNRALPADEIMSDDQLIGIGLEQSDVLKTAPIVDAAARSVVFPVKKGTDVTALRPKFSAAEGVTVSPASGAAVDLSTPVEYTLTAPGGETATWTFKS